VRHLKRDFFKRGLGVALAVGAGLLSGGAGVQGAEGEKEAAVYEGPESGIDPAHAPELWKIGAQVLKRVATPEPGYPAYEPTAADKALGMVVYRRDEPRLCRYTSAAAPWEVGKPIETFGAPGQTVDVWLSVQGLEDLKGVDVTLAWPGKPSASAYVLKDWVQLRSLYSTSTFYVTPEVLEPMGEAGISVPKGESRTFWLTFDIPADAVAGVVGLEAVISREGKKIATVPVSVRVMPIVLEKPQNKYWGLYTTSSVRWGKLTDAQLKAELTDYKRAGINSVVIDMFGQSGAGFKIVDGKVTDFSAPVVERFQRIRQEVGLSGPVVLYFGPRLELSLIGARGEKPTGFFDPLPQMKDEVFNGQFRALVGEFDALIKRTGKGPGYQDWYFAGIDEPGVSLGRQQRAFWECQQAQAAGAKTWTTLHGEFSNEVAPVMNVPVFHRGWSVQNAAQVRDRVAETGKFKQPFWVYGSGAYENQEGNTIQNRHHNGVMMYKLGLDGMVSWTYQWPGADTTSDFVSEKKKAPGKVAMMTYTRADGVVMPTLQWVGTRMGIDDYRYLATLEKAIGEALKSSDANAQAAGKAAKGELEERMRLVPWADPLPEGFDMDLFGDAEAQGIRWFAAQKIVALEGLMKKGGGK
jgi:hypothetical protein